MHITDLKSLESGKIINADIIIIGGGAAGITLARELFGESLDVVILESGGLIETQENERLNAVEISAEPNTPAQIAKRRQFHADLAHFWSQEVQPFGVRCRVLGGATAAWAGKSAPFDTIDFAERPWIPHSGWPITRESLDPYLERAGERLNLGPVINDAELWSRIGVMPDKALSRMHALRSFFWQFARSRIDALDIMRFGPEFAQEHADNVKVYTHATVGELHLNAAGDAFSHADVLSSDGLVSVTVRAPIAVIAASAIENARLLLASRSSEPNGIGNRYDNVGRYLMDHPGARVASFPKKDAPKVYKPFSFFALTDNEKTQMYMHGMALSPEMQAQDKMLNCAFYMLEDRAQDDPWDAIKRLVKRQSRSVLADVLSILTSPGIIITGIGRKVLQSPKIPTFLKKRIVDLAILFNPNFAVREFQSGGLPHKLQGVHIDVITEQPPLRENRITLSAHKDRLGRPLAQIEWRVGDEAKAAIAYMARLISAEFVKAGLPKPMLEDWVQKDARDEAVIIDMAHTAGTTRMSRLPEDGVVDENCMVHGVNGLFVMGASVFPTSGHANPTLMIATLAIRLADWLKVNGPSMRRPYVNTGAPMILVTGALDNMGPQVCEALLAAGYQVRGQYTSEAGRDLRIDWQPADFLSDKTDTEVFDRLVEGCAGVIHLAAAYTEPSEMVKLNVETTDALRKAAQRTGLRYFGLASSVVVYGSPKKCKVDEASPLIDITKPLSKQYFAEPYMLEYARTRVLSEKAVAADPTSEMKVDIYRISVEASLERMRECLSWGKPRRLLSTYRNSQYIYEKDVAAAMVHLLKRGLSGTARGTEVFNIADADAPTHEAIFARAFELTGNARHKPGFHIPVVFDRLKDILKYKSLASRKHLGMIRFSNAALLKTGFVAPYGIKRALDESLGDTEVS